MGDGNVRSKTPCWGSPSAPARQKKRGRGGRRVAHGPVKTLAPEEAILETSCAAPTPAGTEDEERPLPPSLPGAGHPL